MGDEDEDNDEDADAPARRRHPPKFKRIKLDWNSPSAPKLRCSTRDVNQIAKMKADLCEDESSWTKGGASTGEAGSRTTTTEWRCSFKAKLGNKAVVREERPGDVG